MNDGAEQSSQSWGGGSRSVSRHLHPHTLSDVCRAIPASSSRGLIVRGYGRSYGDQCLNDGGTVVETTAFNKIRSFDADSGVICCDAGVSFADVMQLCTSRGWIPPVCPGTSFVSMGGAIANDVHGKNEHVAGTFADHIEWFDLLLSSGAVQRVTRVGESTLFAATVGGIGLTGIIVAVQFQLQRAPANAFTVVEQRVSDLDAFLRALTDGQANSEHVVGWIDALERGRAMGRGILQCANVATENVAAPAVRTFNVPFNMPQWLLNSQTVSAFNSLYFHRVPKRGRQSRVHVQKFLYPLDALHNWNRLYGANGIYQFQCVVPTASARESLLAIMELVTHSGSASFLAVIKTLSKTGSGMLSFAQPGFSLALDFPRRAATFALIQRLHEIVVQYGGRVYLAKDACLDPRHFRSMYPQLARFESALNQFDPGQIMQSDMSRRLGIRADSRDSVRA